MERTKFTFAAREAEYRAYRDFDEDDRERRQAERERWQARRHKAAARAQVWGGR